MLNEVTLIGNVGRDPEFITMKNGKLMGKVTVATTKKFKDANGERKDKTEWHNVIVWNDKLASVLQKHLVKGSKVYVKGEIQTRKYQNKEGQDCYATDIVISDFAHTIMFLDSKQSGSTGYQKQAPRVAPKDLDDEMF